jgi:hypothetical protein
MQLRLDRSPKIEASTSLNFCNVILAELTVLAFDGGSGFGCWTLNQVY